ncbi:glycosyltransferase [Robertkochia solimangrovi]|uniref:glycosyltransferase n=1 Tax=Robertkochia solimangrovi TaxID=2213046 RepID=UPI00118129F7|nr:glycosyltransferase [Robertkochia solimangrovi]TRZ45353.1 glycosyl transferase family 1 [Robertkochia solimangrovi]
MKKVLIITYYWPPAGGPGVQRWLKFVKYLPEFQIHPVVYIPENPTYPILDETFIKEVPTKDITMISQPIREPYRLASFFSNKKTRSISKGMISQKKQSLPEKFLLWVRGNIFIPDARVLWVKPSVHFLKDYIEKEGIDTIITTGPPHSLHLIGLRLKSLMELRWIADFRDPWTNIGYHDKLRLGGRAAARHERLEKEVLTKADKVITTSNTTAREFNEIAPADITVITNGFEPLNNLKKPALKFQIGHIGSLLTGRDPQLLWNALSLLISEDPEFANAFNLVLAGAVSDDVRSSIGKAGLEGYTTYMGYVSHEKALELQQTSRVLLLLEIDSPQTKGIIPGKVFEYMSARRPVLAIGPDGWEVKQLIQESGIGACFTYTDEASILKFIKTNFERYKSGLNAEISGDIEGYTRRSLTSKLAELIKGSWE